MLSSPLRIKFLELNEVSTIVVVVNFQPALLEPVYAPAIVCIALSPKAVASGLDPSLVKVGGVDADRAAAVFVALNFSVHKAVVWKPLLVVSVPS